MKIAQVAPLALRVPPEGYGGTERVVSYLTEELVRQGHDVTLFAGADAVTAARLVAPHAGAAWPVKPANRWAYELLQRERVFEQAHAFDVLHFHLWFTHFPMARRAPTPHLSTLHWLLNYPELKPLYEEYREAPVVSVSEAQRGPAPMLNWLGTVYHGLSKDRYTLRDEPGGYLAYLGRLAPAKGVEEAIEIARRAGMPLKMAGAILHTERSYFEAAIKPRLADPGVEYVGEINDRGKQALLGGARALLFPTRLRESFGLVMIEAMACGTPVIGFRRGAVPEVVQDGVTGFVVDDLEEAVQAVERLGRLSRAVCRQVFEDRFTAQRMAEDYVALYRRLAGQ